MTHLPRHAVEEALPPPPRDVSPGQVCPLCRYRFIVGREVCGSCGLGGGCEAVGCPHCGYQFPVESSIINWFRRRLRHAFGHRAPSA